MKELLQLVEKIQGFHLFIGPLSINVFPDGSGHLHDDDDTRIFHFNSINQGIEKATKLLEVIN